MIPTLQPDIPIKIFYIYTINIICHSINYRVQKGYKNVTQVTISQESLKISRSVPSTQSKLPPIKKHQLNDKKISKYYQMMLYNLINRRFPFPSIDVPVLLATSLYAFNGNFAEIQSDKCINVLTLSVIVAENSIVCLPF